MAGIDLFLMQDTPYPEFVDVARLAEDVGCANLWLIAGQDVFPDPFAVEFGAQWGKSPKASEKQVAAMIAYIRAARSDIDACDAAAIMSVEPPFPDPAALIGATAEGGGT